MRSQKSEKFLGCVHHLRNSLSHNEIVFEILRKNLPLKGKKETYIYSAAIDESIKYVCISVTFKLKIHLAHEFIMCAFY